LAKLAPVASHINVQKFRELGKDFYDQQIFDLLQFGFPLDLDKSNFLPNLAVGNHGSALQFPVEVQAYLDEEIKLGSILGPFEDPPFPDLHCSPLMTAPKDGNKRRIIVDLSYSSVQYQAVNTSISKTSYVRTPFSLKLPTVDTICHALNLIGKNVKIFKVDLARAFRQLFLDPFDVKYLGLGWKGAYYVDVSVPFGWRNGILAYERVTDAIRHILATKGIFVLNYFDDIVGIAPSDVADNQLLLAYLNNWVYLLIIQKLFPPLRWLSISKQKLQALFASLIFLHKANKPARVLLALLKNMGDATRAAIKTRLPMIHFVRSCG
jgi:hypothetical protein